MNLTAMPQLCKASGTEGVSYGKAEAGLRQEKRQGLPSATLLEPSVQMAPRGLVRMGGKSSRDRRQPTWGTPEPWPMGTIAVLTKMKVALTCMKD